MEAGKTPTQNPNSWGRRWATILARFAAIGAMFASVEAVIDALPLEQAAKKWTRIGAYFIIAGISILIWYRDWFRRVVEWMHRCLKSAVPWFVLLLLLLSGATLYATRALLAKPPPPPLSIAINFDLAHGQIFNSWEDQYSGHTHHIRAWGTERDPLFWDIGGRSPDEGGFSYEVDPKLEPSDGASSGGYQSFYDRPADRRVLQRFVFSLQSAETCGKGRADIGVRLTVDNPPDGREYFTYELNSVRAKKGTIDNSWRRFEIPVSEFLRVPRVHSSAPLPRALDEHSINKVVFFVNNAIVRQCPKNTLQIRDVSFQP